MLCFNIRAFVQFCAGCGMVGVTLVCLYIQAGLDTNDVRKKCLQFSHDDDDGA